MVARDELSAVAARFERIVEAGKATAVQEPLRRLQEATEKVGESASGSWLGHHANVYYKDLKPPPPGSHFSQEWGGTPSAFGHGTTGEWYEHRPEEVEAAIHELAGGPDLVLARGLRDEVASVLDEEKLRILSIVESSGVADEFLRRVVKDIDELALPTEVKIVKALRPQGKFITHDSLAASQGTWVPAHISVLAQVFAIRQALKIAERFYRLTKQAGEHLMRLERNRPPETGGTTVFIGHGRSLVWRELKDFLEDRLGLTVEEFNSASAAGLPTVERLAEMLHAATFAFLVMTAEDEQRDGTVNPRLNVVHEVGLFQGRLGFDRAIVVLEDGCEEFSNIAGLGQIRFPAGNVASKFEEVRLVLEREGVLPDA